jgi:hypothetical protein
LNPSVVAAFIDLTDILSERNTWQLCAVRCKSRIYLRTRIFTVGLQRLTIRRAHNALQLDVSVINLSRSEAAESKVSSGSYQRDDNHGQSDGQQELGEHMGSNCWGGVARRHVGEC